MTFDHPAELKPPYDLIWGAITNAKNPTFSPLCLWVVVMKIFGCGSTRAVNLCTHYGFDPDKELPPIKNSCPNCDISIYATEDDTIVLNRDGSWEETIYASCPEQARNFAKTYEGTSFQSVEEWRNLLEEYQVGWKTTIEDYDE